MKTLSKIPIPLFLIALALAGIIGLEPTAQAVSPPPDGGYPGGNTAEGQSALLSLTTGGYNTGIGYFALRNDTTNSFNTAIGAGTLVATTADLNTAIGTGALLSNTTGGQNTATGAFALLRNTTGSQNTAVGEEALWNNITGHTNVAVGWGTLLANISGNDNTVIGYESLEFSTSDGNVALGAFAASSVTTAGNVICIGYNVLGANVSNSCFIGNIRGTATSQNDAIPVLIDSFGQLGTQSSSRRFKTDIKSMDSASKAIMALRPVSFHYKSDNRNRPEFGLIAEDVAKVNPDLVIYDSDGKPYTVRYDAVNAMLLNEFLKEHRKVEELQATVAQQRKDSQATAAQQQKQIEALTAGLQKVSAQVATSKPAPQVAENNQ
jgi:hypothetical protein